MPDILHRVGIKASPEKVFEALSTIDGIRHWWIVETVGETKKDGIIDFGFSQMKVAKSETREVSPMEVCGWPEEVAGYRGDLSAEMEGRTDICHFQACQVEEAYRIYAPLRHEVGGLSLEFKRLVGEARRSSRTL